MKVTGLEHVAVVVRDLDAVASLFERVFGLPGSSPEDVEKDRVRVVKIPVGDTDLELVTPTHADSSISKFLDKRGEGLHHICLRVEDLDSALSALKEHGVRLIDEEPRVGATGCRVAFVHPKSVGGILIELAETGGAEAEASPRD